MEEKKSDLVDFMNSIGCKWFETELLCRKCGEQTVHYRVWESSDGAFEDENYVCTNCGCEWWVDGPDA